MVFNSASQRKAVMAKLSKKKIKYFMKDEKKAVAEYKKYGLYNLAKDESKHYYFLKRLK
jgi:hypothetical protein